jgi:phosphatidylglycerophosphatase A
MTMADPAADPAASPRALPVWHPASLIATGFGIGCLPKAPGTWASLAALPLAWLADQAAGRAGIAIAGVAIALIGVWASQIYVDHHRVQDPGEIVIDEVAAQLLALTAVPLTFVSLIAGFLLFRLFDIVKPWPVSWADRSVKGGWGVMLDDLLAAAYAAIGLSLLTLLQNALFDVP